MKLLTTWLGVLAIAISAISLAGCGSSSSPTAPSGNGGRTFPAAVTPVPTPTGPPFSIALVVPGGSVPADVAVAMTMSVAYMSGAPSRESANCGNGQPTQLFDSRLGPQPFNCTYSTAGTYTVTVTATAASGFTATAAAAVVVLPTQGAPSNITLFSDDYTRDSSSDTWNFSLTTDQGTLSNINWALGDGSTASGAFVQHTYTSQGLKTVRVSATLTRSDGVTQQNLMRDISVEFGP